MARRRIKSVRVGLCSVSIHRDSEWDEYVVTAKASPAAVGVLQARKLSGTYHTSDKQDARNTAAQQIKMLRRGGC